MYRGHFLGREGVEHACGHESGDLDQMCGWDGMGWITYMRLRCIGGTERGKEGAKAFGYCIKFGFEF